MALVLNLHVALRGALRGKQHAGVLKGFSALRFQQICTERRLSLPGYPGTIAESSSTPGQWYNSTPTTRGTGYYYPGTSGF
eukprot:2102818-Rhodomonas_salina.1